MNTMSFYDVISELNINLENRLLTVCEGDHAGEKMIVSAGRPVWISDEAGFFAAHGNEAMGAEDGSLSEIGGECVFAEFLGNAGRRKKWSAAERVMFPCL